MSGGALQPSSVAPASLPLLPTAGASHTRAIVHIPLADNWSQMLLARMLWFQLPTSEYCYNNQNTTIRLRVGCLVINLYFDSDCLSSLFVCFGTLGELIVGVVFAKMSLSVLALMPNMTEVLGWKTEAEGKCWLCEIENNSNYKKINTFCIYWLFPWSKTMDNFVQITSRIIHLSI